jgi:hypothetical protein
MGIHSGGEFHGHSCGGGCLTKAELARRAEAGRALNALRQTHAGGRPKVLYGSAPNAAAKWARASCARTAVKRSLQLQAATGKQHLGGP